MNYYLMSALSMSIAPAAVAGFVRRKKIDSSYAPFLWLLWVGLVNEVLSYFLILWFRNNFYNYNLFLLLEAVLLCLLFKRQGFFGERKWPVPVLTGVLGSFWVAELFLAGLERFQSYSLILYSVLIAVFSIELMNRVVFRENQVLWRNALFLLCLCFTVSYGWGIAVEIFLLLGLQRSAFYQVFIYDFSVYLNALLNLIYFVAVLWMPLNSRLLLQPSGC